MMKSKKVYIWLLFLIASLSSCLNKQDSFQLNGIFSAGQEDNYIMLFTFRNGQIHSVDTTRIKNGEFVFKGKEYLDDIALVSYGNYPDEVWYAEIILEKGNIFLKMGYTDSIGGTPLNNLYQSHKDTLKIFGK